MAAHFSPVAHTGKQEVASPFLPARGLLAGPLRARINQLAHSHALQYEMSLRASLLAQVLTARSDGASFADLAELVGKLEATPS